MALPSLSPSQGRHRHSWRCPRERRGGAALLEMWPATYKPIGAKATIASRFSSTQRWHPRIRPVRLGKRGLGLIAAARLCADRLRAALRPPATSPHRRSDAARRPDALPQPTWRSASPSRRAESARDRANLLGLLALRSSITRYASGPSWASKMPSASAYAPRAPRPEPGVRERIAAGRSQRPPDSAPCEVLSSRTISGSLAASVGGAS